MTYFHRFFWTIHGVLAAGNNSNKRAYKPIWAMPICQRGLGIIMCPRSSESILCMSLKVISRIFYYLTHYFLSFGEYPFQNLFMCFLGLSWLTQIRYELLSVSNEHVHFLKGRCPTHITQPSSTEFVIALGSSDCEGRSCNKNTKTPLCEFAWQRQETEDHGTLARKIFLYRNAHGAFSVWHISIAMCHLISRVRSSRKHLAPVHIKISSDCEM